jgi:two-component system, sensor histidine kinase and response regulator
LADLALNSSKRLMHVLNDLLDFSKLEAGKVELEQRELEPSVIVGDAVLACRSQTLGKNIQIESHIDPEIPKTMLGDQLRVSQILLNFVSNAAKFTKSGIIRISADLISQDNESTVVRFSVRDSGAGISQETMEKLFQPFVQADASTFRRHGGSGLGLSIAKHFAQLMGGTTGATSEPDNGSTFWADLPFKKTPAKS